MNYLIFRDDSKSQASGSRWGVILVAVLSMFFFVDAIAAQDGESTGREALSKRSYPWYDAETEGVKRIDLKDRPDSKSTNRHNIPLAPPKQKLKKKGFANGFSGFFDGLGILVWGLMAAGLVLIVVLLVWAFLKLETNTESDDGNGPRRSMAESIKQLPFELESAGGDFRQLAHSAYSNGDYRKAIIYLFSHVLVSLDQKSLIRLRKGKTNRQYLRELRSHRELSNYYQRVMVPFEATFFGEHELEQQEFESCWSHLDGFQENIQHTAQVTDA